MITLEGFQKNITLAFLKATFLVLHLFCCTFMTFLMMLSVTLLVYADDTALYSQCKQSSDLWQQLEMAADLAFDLRDCVNSGRK